MFLEERHGRIMEELNTHRRVLVSDLSEKLAVSMDTIRRDLANLESKGVLKRTYGGAILPEGIGECPPIEVRKNIHTGQKNRLASHAVSLLHDGDAVFLDGSSTVLAMLPYMKQHKNLLIVTNSLEITLAAESLDGSNQIYLLGGTVARKINSTLGCDTLEKLSGMRFDKVFMSAMGFDAEGIYDTDFDEVALKRKVVSCGLETYFIMDASKYGRMSTLLLCDYQQGFKVITDKETDSVSESDTGSDGKGVVAGNIYEYVGGK